MKGSPFKYLILVTVFTLTAITPIYAEKVEIKPSPNYLIILVHGINTSSRFFAGKDVGGYTGEKGSDLTYEPESDDDYGDLKGYLENELGLKGYVYSYTFSQRDGKIDLMANELGNPDWDNRAYIEGGWLHLKKAADIPKEKTKITEFINGKPMGQGNSWFEQAREDFIDWFMDPKRNHKNPLGRRPTEEEIPDRYILISHSLGGLACRAYMSSNFYNNDVAELITIDGQHLGSNAALALKKLDEFYENKENERQYGELLALTLLALWAQQDTLGIFTGICAIIMPGSRHIVDNFLIKEQLGWYPTQPGVRDADIQGSFIQDLNSKAFINSSDPLRVRAISARGVPTPSGDLPENRYRLGLESIQRIMSSSYLNELPLGGKLMAIYMSIALGAIVDQDGDIYGTQKSQIAEGLSSLNANNIDFKRYTYLFGKDTDVLTDAIVGASAAVAAANVVNLFMGGQGSVPLKFALIAAAGAIACKGFEYRFQTYLSAHGLILREAYEGKMIDLALEDTPLVGGNFTMEVESSAPAQTFSLQSNLITDEGTGEIIETEKYHAVKVESFNTSNSDNRSQLFPTVINGQKKWVESISVKEPPTKIKGVINTFLPKKLKYFQYSENFSAWKNISSVDEWGNFEIEGLKLAEGQNVIAFRAENMAGYTSNQQLKIILNTIPQYVNKPYPEPNSTTNNIYHEIGVEADKACYSNDPSEKIEVVSFLIDGVEKISEANIVTSQETYKAHAKAEWIPKVPLTEGQHDVLVKFQSNVGASQAIWSFNVDTIAPMVSVSTLEPYSPRAPTAEKLNIKFQTADNMSAFLNNLSVRLYRGTQPDENNNFISEITRVATQAAGDHFIAWDGKDGNGNYVADGIYTIRVKAFDQAGNWNAATAQVKIDSSPPQILEAHVSPNPMTKNTNQFGFAGKISEDSTVILKLTNLSENQTSSYITRGQEVNYVWRFDNTFTPNLRDGLYKLEIIARDEAGNESLPYVIKDIKIDRTPPVIFSEYTDPFVLSNNGSSPYSTILRYQLSESNDAADNKQLTTNEIKVKVKLYNENTGDLLWSQNASGSLTAENTLSWNASSSSIAKGAYKFQITAYDAAGNYSTAYATCVKDGVAPAISYPLEGSEISGIVAVRGTAMDPDWTNNLGFKEYRVYYAKGKLSPTTNPGTEWKSDFIEVPEIYQDPESGIKNQSIRPLQNDATLAYFYASSLEDGEYTILVIAAEDGGTAYASARTLNIANNSLGVSANPSISLGEIPSEITFDGNNVLPISFTYGGKEINAYAEILKITNSGSREAVYYKYFPKLTADFYTGRPSYSELGYFIWQDESGWHVRWNGDGKEHRFNGSLVAGGSISELNLVGDGITQTSSVINWDRNMSGGEEGFDFKTDSSQLIISTWIDDDPATMDDDFDSLAVPYFGLSKYKPAYSPVIITGITGQTGTTGQSVNWNGKLESSAFVDSGDYVVRVRAEGTDGIGLTVVEKNLKVNTPFELTNLKVSSTAFDPIGMPDRVTVSYNISKDALIKLKIYNPGSSAPLAVIDDGIQLGKTNPDSPHTISWEGNYPDKNGTQVVTSGEYILKLAASAVDGTQTIEKTISPNVKVETLGASSLVQLDPIGEEVKFNGGTVRAAQGSSDYYWEAKASGTYYPPINYDFTLGLKGMQRATVYPYVPFSGILHRNFSKVFGQAKVKFKLYCYKHKHADLDVFKMFPPEVKHGIIDVESDFFPFEMTKDKLEVKRTFDFSASLLGWEGITRADVSVLFYSNSGFLLDDMNDDYLEAAWNQLPPENVCKSAKGIFEVKARRSYEIASFNEKCRVHISLSLADGLDYSRLTNRFVPWFGFVNKNHPKNTDELNIPLMVNDITKLGFPGKVFFEDPNVIISGEVRANKEYEDILRNIANYDTYEELKTALDKVAEDSYFDGYSGSHDVTSGYDSYLSGENFEFISVSDPSQFKREGMRWTAWVDYEKSGDESPLTFKWPYDSQEYLEQNKVWHDDRLAYLEKNPQAYSVSNTAYEIDEQELKDRMSDFKAAYPEAVIEGRCVKKQIPQDVLRYSKSQDKYYGELETTPGDLIKPPDYLIGPNYSILEKSPKDINVSFDAQNQNSQITVSSTRNGQPWSTSIKGGPETFNKDCFSADGKSEPYYFWDTEEGKLIDNSNVVIDGWQVILRDESGQINQDLVPIVFEDSFKAKLKYQAKERRLVKLTGKADSDYELMYYDGSAWKEIAKGKPSLGNFTSFWDVGRLCGKHSVLLKTSYAVASKDVYIGDLVYFGLDDPENKRVTSAYKRAELQFKPTSFGQDRFSSVTPVSMTEIYIRNKPIIMTHGPIVELKPSPTTFETEVRPFLKFLYTADDLQEGYDIAVLPNDPDWKSKTQGLTIHQVTAAGDLQVIDDQKNYLETDQATGLPYFAFEAALDHFSTYTLLKGKFQLSAPIVFASSYITNQDTVTIYGTAEPGSILQLYVKTENIPPDPKKGESPIAKTTASPDKGDYRFESVSLLQEGKNYVFVTSHLKDSPEVMTFGDVMIIKDTVPPKISAKPDLHAFSPNGDGKYDSVNLFVKMDEKGKIIFSVQDSIDREISAEPNMEYKINWASSTYADGEYIITVYAIDEAGNISENIINKIIVDTTSPTVLGLNVNPNPFTPNDDGVNDTTKFWYKLSEPVYATLMIYRDDGGLFRKHEGPTINFQYPTSSIVYRPSSIGSWEWNGRGSRNELLGGTYTWMIYAEDWVGNAVSSEIKTIVVDRAPSLIPYAYAEPDPFAPVNVNNNFTEIKYYISRDNVKVSVSILGEGGQSIKDLANDQVQNRGEHSVRWYGDYASGYTGPKSVKNEYRVGDGSYEFKVYVEDPNEGQSANVTNTVLVDNTPPYIVTKPLQVDYAQQRASLFYNIPENSEIGIDVYSLDGSHIATLASAESEPAGDHALVYDFSGQSGGMEGLRYFKITATDRAKNTAEKITESFAVMPDQLSISNHQAVPAVFTPNGDGHTDLTRIQYSLSGGEPDYNVSINLVNPTGSTVKHLIENEPQASGTYSFYWVGKDDGGRTIDDGRYDYVIKVEDKGGAGCEVQGAILVVSTKPTVDLSTSLPVFSPNGNGSNETVVINYSVNYPIQYITGEALVKLEILNATGEAVWSRIFSHTAGSYAFEYDGNTSNGGYLTAGNYYVRLSAEDALGSPAVPKLLGLAVDYTQSIPIDVNDKTPPQISNLSVDPNPASVPEVSGQVSIKFNVSEALKQAPKVSVTQSGASPQLAIVSGNWSQANGQCEAKYDVFTGNDGTALISIEVTDLANNLAIYPSNNLLKIDTITPTFSNIQSEISSNPDFSKFAKEGSEVSIRFKVSEPLKFNPDVKVNNNPASYDGLNSGEYIYKYTVSSSDDEGNATINISGFDFAGNEGAFETLSSSESFVIDLVNPTVLIDSPETQMIANPGSFSTNTNPDGSDRPRSTTLYYRLAEYSKVTVKVHKVGDSQTTYTKSDFSESSLITTLVNGEWQDGGIQHSIKWDGKIESNQALYDLEGDGYADPGKYAFIVEGTDKAGNLTLKKWGGTVWIQNNVLGLREPEQLEYQKEGLSVSNNPDPSIISPNGNSTAPTQKRARFYFMIGLSLNPTQTTAPERIEAAAVIAETKKIGKYSVKVYSDSQLNNLVCVVTSEADAWAATLTWEDWDGKNDAGQFVSDGTYYIVVDVKDFAGNPADNNLLKRTVIVDNTSPVVSNLFASPYYFAPGNTDATIKTTTLEYEVSDNSGKSKVTVDVYKDTAFVKTLSSEVWRNNGNYLQIWDGSGPTGYVGTKNGSSFGDGIYTFRVSAVDEAGNSAAVKSQSVYVDTQGPNSPNLSSITHNGGDFAPVSPSWSTHGSPYITWSDPGDNGGSGVSRYEVSIDGSAWINLASQTFWHSTLADGDSRTVDIRAVDTLGNLGTAARLTFRIDTVDPYFSSGPAVDNSHTPATIWSSHNSPRMTFSGADSVSGVASYSVFVDSTEYTDKSSPWEQVLGDGTHTVKIRVYDNAGRYIDSSSYAFNIDTTPPNSPSVSVSHTPVDTWSNHDSPYFTWQDPGDGNGSGVSYYRGYIDGVDQGYVSSGWHPSLTEGTHSVYIRAVDVVGYSSSSATYNFKIDTKPPAITGISDLPDPFSPGNPDGNKDTITFYYTIDESATVSLYVDGLQKYQEAKTAGSYSFTWNPGSSIGEGSHGYYISAIDQALNSSSSAAYYFAVDNTPPSSAPSGLIATSGNGVANLSWNSVSDANGYDVYRSSTYNGSYVKLNSSLIAGASYQDTGLSNGTRYWYKVKAADNAGNESAFSGYVAATPGVLGNTKILFISARDGNSEVYRMDANGSNQIRITNSGLWEGDPSFSPNGSQIVFVSKTSAGAPDIYKMNPDGSNQIKLTNTIAREYCPIYSPDGTKIVFETDRDADLKYEIYVMNTDGSNPVRLTNNNSWDRYPSFSPDGTEIVFYSDRDGNLEIYRMDANGSNQVRLTNNTAADSFPSFSPDGTKIVFSSNRDGGPYEIYIMDEDGSNQVRLTNNSGDDLCPRFSPDGTKIVFHGINNGQFQVFKMDINGANLIQLTSTSVFDGRPFWSPFVPGMGAFSVSNQVQSQQLTTLEAPALLAPDDEDHVRSLRPIFKWRHHRANTQEYKIDLAKNDTFSIAHQNFTKSANTGSQDKDDVNLYHYTYSIHEFDPGLDRETYYWKVTALTTSEAATSEVRSFTVAPELTLTGITNYPNPFDPNRETTKIRYRLGADVDEVKIRIYDITGSIVKNFTNCPTQGEGASVWDKYQDVDWDGRNDRGYLVVNGIYPFEVIARLGDKTVSGRGKIAVLK